MMRLIRILLLTAGAVLVLLVAVVALVALLFDPNDYRDRIASAVEEQTGREFVIEGELELRLFPWLRVTTGAMQLGNAPGFADEPFARIEGMSAGIRLWPLLRREVEIGTVRLAGLTLNLEVDERGTGNWEDLVEAAAQDDAPVEAPADAADGFELASFSLGGVEIIDASVTYRDRQAGQTYALSGFNLTLGTVRPGQPVDARFDFGLRQQQPQISGEVAGRATLMLDPAADRLELENLRVDARLAGEPGAPFARIEADVRLGSASGQPQAGRYRAASLEVTALAVGEAFPRERFDGRLSARSAEIDLPAGTLSLDGFRAQTLGLEFEATLTGSGLNDVLGLEGRFTVPEFSPRETMQALEIAFDPADASALTRASASGQLRLDGQDLRLSELSFRLDDTMLTGDFGVVAERILFDLDVDDINVDRYLPPPEDDTDAPEDTGSLDEVDVPVELLRDLNAEGRFGVGRAVLAGLEFTNLELGVSAADGLVRLHPLGSDLFGGRYDGDIRMDVTGNEPRLTLNERVQDVQLSNLSQAMFDVEHVTGRIDGSFDLTATGHNLGQMRRRLNGEMAFSMREGAWEGVDVWHQVRTANALFRQRSAPEQPDGPPRTEFTEVTGTAQVTDGVLVNEDFVGLLPFMRMTGSGQVNLVEGMLDYRLTATFIDSPELARDSALADLGGRSLPMRIDGELTSPRLRPDFSAMVTDELRDRAADRVRDEVSRRLGLGRERDEAPEDEGDGEGTDTDEAEAESERPQDQLQRRLRDLLR